MKTSLSLAIVAVLVFSGMLQAQTWTTPDGFLSVTEPNDETFVALPSPPEPFVGLWISRDETIKLGVMKTEIPAKIELNQSSVEEGLADEIGGEVTRLPTKEVAGYEVWQMKGTGMAAEITQAIVRHDGTVYKIMAVTLGENRDEQAVHQFIDSLVINEVVKTAEPVAETTGAPVTETTPDQPKKNLGSRFDSHELSKKIGGFAAMLVIGLLIYFFTRGKNKPQS